MAWHRLTQVGLFPCLLLPAGAEDANGNFAAIRNENFSEHGSCSKSLKSTAFQHGLFMNSTVGTVRNVVILRASGEDGRRISADTSGTRRKLRSLPAGRQASANLGGSPQDDGRSCVSLPITWQVHE
jgi:hypothetical protein